MRHSLFITRPQGQAKQMELSKGCIKGGMLQAHKRQTLSNAEDIFLSIPIYSDPDKGKFVLFNKSG